jgi:hypothetical protein
MKLKIYKCQMFNKLHLFQEAAKQRVLEPKKRKKRHWNSYLKVHIQHHKQETSLTKLGILKGHGVGTSKTKDYCKARYYRFAWQI